MAHEVSFRGRYLIVSERRGQVSAQGFWRDKEGGDKPAPFGGKRLLPNTYP